MHQGSTLDPALQNARRVALFGGSFDPPHGGHLAMARGAQKACCLEHVIWTPAARPPHKPERVLAEGSERMEMLACLLQGQPDCSIWSLELEREGQSYTVDTLRSLRAALPERCALFLILGSDNLAGFSSWREAATILELAEPIVLPRSGFPASEDLLGHMAPAVRTRLLAGVLELDPIDISSTEVRQALRATGKRPELLPPALWEYVTGRGIYAR